MSEDKNYAARELRRQDAEDAAAKALIKITLGAAIGAAMMAVIVWGATP